MFYWQFDDRIYLTYQVIKPVEYAEHGSPVNNVKFSLLYVNKVMLWLGIKCILNEWRKKNIKCKLNCYKDFSVSLVRA